MIKVFYVTDMYLFDFYLSKALKKASGDKAPLYIIWIHSSISEQITVSIINKIWI